MAERRECEGTIPEYEYELVNSSRCYARSERHCMRDTSTEGSSMPFLRLQ